MTRNPATNREDVVEQLVANMLDQIEATPRQALDLAYNARQLTALNEELATLIFDSGREGDPVLTRGSEGQTRLMSFANDHLSLELTLLPDGVTLVGELAPVDTRELDIETDGGDTVTIEIDEFGRFRATTAPGPIRLRVPGRLVTPWITR
ncbi:MAG: hypothetical protein GY724_23130 [Actinomycetia bacterium]|nr:hypothetical protein [Actinomycetes bacterium]MCP5035437.1 hypothetical protein [Actinomycetes bacterium]